MLFKNFISSTKHLFFFSQCMHMHGIFITSSWFRAFAKHLSCIPMQWQTPLIEGLGPNLPPFNCELCSGIFVWNFKLSNLNYLIYLKDEINVFHGEQSSIISVGVTGETFCVPTPEFAPETAVVFGATNFWFFTPRDSEFILPFSNPFLELSIGWDSLRLWNEKLNWFEIVPNRRSLSVNSP